MIRILFLALILLMAAHTYNVSQAEEAEIPVTPGLYTITVTTSSDKSSNSAKNVVDLCISEELLDPKDYLPKAAVCSLANVKKEDNKAVFDIDCKGGSTGQGKTQVPQMKGTGECSTKESEIYCIYNMEGEIQGEVFSVNTKREGKRIGDCPE